MEWRERGACNSGDGKNIALFYGSHVCWSECDGPKGCIEARKERGKRERVVAAKKLCNVCTVRSTCLEWALSYPELVGIWGGTTERERRQIRRKRNGR